MLQSDWLRYSLSIRARNLVVNWLKYLAHPNIKQRTLLQSYPTRTYLYKFLTPISISNQSDKDICDHWVPERTGENMRCWRSDSLLSIEMLQRKKRSDTWSEEKKEKIRHMKRREAGKEKMVKREKGEEREEREKGVRKVREKGKKGEK